MIHTEKGVHGSLYASTMFYVCLEPDTNELELVVPLQKKNKTPVYSGRIRPVKGAVYIDLCNLISESYHLLDTFMCHHMQLCGNIQLQL